MKTLEEIQACYDDDPLLAARYAVGWEGSGEGHGVHARELWPACPGYDWDDGVPCWCEIDGEEGYEYRTVIGDFGPFSAPVPDGWEKVHQWSVAPEHDVTDEDGQLGVVYIGEYVVTVVYRRTTEK